MPLVISPRARDRDDVIRPPSILACTVVLAAVSVMLNTRGFGWTLNMARRVRHADSPTRRLAQKIIEQTTHNVAVAGALFPGRARCLEQSLALYTVLRRRGAAAEIRIGVQPFRFRAHAWVECDGIPVNETLEMVRGFV
jgi:Transglutaminase-like superfamily